MGFDIRLPIGSMFSLFGFLLSAYGLATRDSAIYEQHSLGVNVNLWWGAVMLLFGVVMLLLFRTRMRKPNGGSTQGGRSWERDPEP